MTNETEAMRKARHALQELSASDPTASANMMRHAVAYALMVTGRRGRERRRNEPQIGAGFILTHGDENLFAAAARRSGTDYLYVSFDVDEASAAPAALDVFSRRGDDMVVFGNCRLWAPANDGRALLVPQSADGYGGYLAFRPGQPFRHVYAPLPGNFDAGVRRADVRLRRTLASYALRDVHREGFMHVIHNKRDAIYVNTSRLAA
jgi:hypothetical protein